MKKKIILSVVALVLVAAVSVAGTLAWLTAATAPVTNTFTVGNIDITLTETTGTEYHMVPGVEMAKDPCVTVIGGSEKCWLFVKVEKSATFDAYIDSAIADGWTELEAGVYYRVVDAATADQAFGVLDGDSITTKDTVGKTEMDALAAEGAVMPEITFTAYAIQYAKFDTAAAAWAELNA